ncbi:MULTISPECIES: N-acetylglucosamine-6-phosphate deacetylase [unclassified Granulicatella]|uniref:N-acetylglucosamine-6-phosphate deacetylase n=1 Tax=unclassified Granulicatella TaxID=2630493 RepID=UPI001072F93A|nr:MULTISPECIES: N-acetylglucosamine-6-phosphate deacetylase [unclassified Granulicatella]MBF0780779.1 N-acetylglucosamine-6-phosphate deacetylase [Granulicatella sp. 19428wC4_WM01]TFU93852.1 N-acetylglucosamine-6-phosphate deacetylase [Granulicatella sp. WM01]
MEKYIYADKFFFTTQEKGAGYLEIRPDGTFGQYTEQKPKAEIIDYSGYYIAPGLVDTHIHGYAGADVMDNDSQGLKIMSEALLSCGVTSFLPTTLTASTEQLDAVCQTVGQTQVQGAKIKGIFLEGPFFNEKYKGAQNPNYMCDPSIDKLDKWQQLSNGLVNKIALAPERDGAIAFIEHAKKQDVYVAIAHTDATYEQAKAAVDAGASIFVHVYNGMRGLHHREPGVVGAALNCKGVHDELICDGHHVHPVSAKIVMDCNGRENAVLITDCMAAGGQAEGDYKLGELDVIVKDGTARLKDSGSLAGSILKLYQAVQNVIHWGIAEPFEAYRMASYNAAKSVGIEKECGALDEGYPADFIVVTRDYDIHATYLDGVKRYTK